MKKRFSMLIALVMLLTSLIPSFTANAAFSDVTETNPYREAITTLSRLSVINGYDDGTFGADKDISRAEFTAIIVRMLGLDHLSTPITTFPDVKADHWANANIRTAFDLGIINGFDDGTFKPDAPVTYEQALKMLICTLGYEPFADAAGGYPVGYTTQASALKMTDKVTDLSYSQNAPRGVIAQVMFNSLEIPKYEDVGGTLSNSGKTLLKDYLNVVGVKGTLVGVGESTTAECNETLFKTQLAVLENATNETHVINFDDYNITTTELIAMLGNTVQVYFRQDKLSNDKFLYDISNETHKNIEITINSNDIIEYSGNSLKYRTSSDAKTQSATIDMQNLSIRYNGRAVTLNDSNYMVNGQQFPYALNTLFDPSSNNFYGTVKLVGTEGSSSYSMLDIYNYEVFVAQRTVSSTDYKLIDKTTPTNTKTLDPDAINLTITKNGKEIEPTSIVTNDVVLYAESLDHKFASVEVSSSSVSGVIGSKNTSTKILTINNKEYVYSNYFESYMTKENKTYDPGSSIKVYTDSLGTLQWGTVTAAESYYPYAYVISAYESKNEYSLRLFAPSSTSVKSFSSSTSYDIKHFYLADNVKLNGVKTNPSAIITELENNSETQIPGEYYQFVRIGFNSSNEIDNVITVSASGIENTDNTKLVEYDHTATATVKSNTIKDGSTTLYSVESSTPLFVIPYDKTDTDGYALKNAISGSSLQANTTTEYDLAAYDLNTSKYPTFMVWYQKSGETISAGTPITPDTKYSFIWEKVGTSYSDIYDSPITVYKTYDQSTTSTDKQFAPTQKSNDDFSAMSKGDIALFGYDKNGNVDEVRRVLKYSNILPILNSGTYDWTDYKNIVDEDKSPKTIKHTMYNVLQTISDKNLIYVTTDGFVGETLSENNRETLNLSNAKIIKYNATDDTVTAASINDIEGAADGFGTTCSKIAVMSYKAAVDDSNYIPTFVVIYK